MRFQIDKLHTRVVEKIWNIAKNAGLINESSEQSLDEPKVKFADYHKLSEIKEILLV